MNDFRCLKYSRYHPIFKQLYNALLKKTAVHDWMDPVELPFTLS